MSTGSVQRTNSPSKTSSSTTYKGLGKMGAWPWSATILVSFVLSLVIAPQLGYAFPDSQEQTVSVERELDSNKTPTISAQHDYPPGTFLGAQRLGYQQPYGGGYGSPYGQVMGGYGGLGTDPGVTNFDFNCKCQAKSNLAKTLAPAPTDANQAAQQQIQQLQEQIRRLQEQMNRQQAGKSSFEQFAQLLAQADGLDCSCSGSSSPFSHLSGGAQGRGGFPQQPYGQGGMGGANGGSPFGSPYRGSGGYFPQQPYAGGAGQFGGYPPMIKA
ncbi:hypothetical protein DdX_10684 [Ditylenchus destructor]|uniref:Uncharacterized protein n=1 Tax=Ditylenchus destructor TaxID=166010 RepID=A0AAD4N3W4_9BILA|nr:hypothetical protein DdX_10684 [Ditylenchus destructor]